MVVVAICRRGHFLCPCPTTLQSIYTILFWDFVPSNCMRQARELEAGRERAQALWKADTEGKKVKRNRPEPKLAQGELRGRRLSMSIREWRDPFVGKKVESRSTEAV